MIRKEFTDRMAEISGLYKYQAQKLYFAFLKMILEALIRDGKINLRYFGTLYVVSYKETASYPAYKRIIYKPSQLIKDRINGKGEEYTEYDRICDKILSQ